MRATGHSAPDPAASAEGLTAELAVDHVTIDLKIRAVIDFIARAFAVKHRIGMAARAPPQFPARLAEIAAAAEGAVITWLKGA